MGDVITTYGVGKYRISGRVGIAGVLCGVEHCAETFGCCGCDKLPIHKSYCGNDYRIFAARREDYPAGDCGNGIYSCGRVFGREEKIKEIATSGKALLAMTDRQKNWLPHKSDNQFFYEKIRYYSL